MKNFRLWQTAILMLILIAGINEKLHTQTPFPTHINSSNVNTATSAIMVQFGDALGVSPQHISGFLQNMLNEQILSSLSAPNATVQSITDNSIVFKWSNVANAHGYRIGYLNLNSAATGVNSYPTSSAQNYKLPGVPDDLYLVAFQSFRLGRYSTLSIIIQEKDIILYSGGGSGLPCNCPDNDYASIEYIGGQGEGTISYANLDPASSFDLLVGDFSDSPTFENIDPVAVVHGFVPVDGDFDILLNSNCLFGIDGIDYLGFGNTLIGSENYNLSNYSIYLSVCEGSTPEYGNINLSANSTGTKIYPNPFQKELSFDLVVNEQSSISIEIYDVSGRLVKSAVDRIEAGSEDYLTTINTRELPLGLYFCIVKNGKYMERIPVLRTE